MKPTRGKSSDKLNTFSKFFDASNTKTVNNGGSSEIKRLPYHYHRSSMWSDRERPSSLDHMYPEYTSLADVKSSSGSHGSQVRRMNSATEWYGNFPQSEDIFEPKSELIRIPSGTQWFANYPQVPEYGHKSDISLGSTLDSNILENKSMIERIPSTTDWYGNFPQKWDPNSETFHLSSSESIGSTSSDFFAPIKVISGQQVFEGSVEFRGPVRFMGPMYIGDSGVDISELLRRSSRR